MDSIYELKQRMALLERAHASAGMGHFVLDATRMTIEFSSWVRNNIGLNDMPIPLDRLPEIIADHAREEFNRNVAEVLERQEDFAFETEVITASGKVRAQRINGITAFENERTREGLLGYFGIMQEITQEKRKANDLRDAHQAAQSELDARTNLLAIVSHEIRTPLGGILGIIDQLKREVSATERERALALVRDSSEVLLDTLDGLLQQARLGTDDGELETKRFRPLEIAQRVAELFRPLARRKGLRIQVDGSTNNYANGDPARLQQILANIVSNAVKFTQSGLVSIGVTEPVETQANWVFTVSDTGRGMGDETKARLFEPFGPSRSDSLGRSVGAGLGLSITRDLVEAMGGTIRVESELGVGSTFAVTLPLGVETADSVTTDPAPFQGHISILAERSTDQIRIEAIASTHGLNVVDWDQNRALANECEESIWLVATTDELIRLPHQAITHCDQIIALIADREAEQALEDYAKELDLPIKAVPLDQIARSLPDIFAGLAHDPA